MKIIGITGNSGSGKSTISKLISKNYEAKIIDADKIAKEMTKNNGEYLQAIRQAFGNDVIKNNELDRKKLADIVFLNRAEKEKLDGLTFEYVVEEIKKELKIMCVLFTEDVGGILRLEFDQEGSLNLVTEAFDEDLLYDEIGCELKIKQLQKDKQQLFSSLELFYKVFYLEDY